MRAGSPGGRRRSPAHCGHARCRRGCAAARARAGRRSAPARAGPGARRGDLEHPDARGGQGVGPPAAVARHAHTVTGDARWVARSTTMASAPRIPSRAITMRALMPAPPHSPRAGRRCSGRACSRPGSARGRRPHRCAKGGVGAERGAGPRRPPRVVGRARAARRVPVADHLGDAPHCRGHHREAGGHGLEHGHGQFSAAEVSAKSGRARRAGRGRPPGPGASTRPASAGAAARRVTSSQSGPSPATSTRRSGTSATASRRSSIRFTSARTPSHSAVGGASAGSASSRAGTKRSASTPLGTTSTMPGARPTCSIAKRATAALGTTTRACPHRVTSRSPVR